MFLIQKNRGKILGFGVVLLLFLTRCTEPPPPTLSSDDRKFADSLYRDSVNYLKPVIDSLCELNFDKNVQATVDSIMTERLEEIRKQMERINGK
ncbi:MAG: hypothetical protein ACI9XO_002178 [Paraglaciecola sp.]|jgi:hypothetical protein